VTPFSPLRTKQAHGALLCLPPSPFRPPISDGPRQASSDRTKQSSRANTPHLRPTHPPHIRKLFYLCAVFVVLPFFDIPFIGLSVTAPLMLPVIYYALFQPVRRWFHQYRRWFLIAAAIWLGIAAALLANGPWFEPRQMQAVEFAYLIRYFYWLCVFVVTAWIASDVLVQRRLGSLLAVAVVVLACLRCFEGIVLGRMGAWVRCSPKIRPVVKLRK